MLNYQKTICRRIPRCFQCADRSEQAARLSRAAGKACRGREGRDAPGAHSLPGRLYGISRSADHRFKSLCRPTEPGELRSRTKRSALVQLYSALGGGWQH